MVRWAPDPQLVTMLDSIGGAPGSCQVLGPRASDRAEATHGFLPGRSSACVLVPLEPAAATVTALRHHLSGGRWAGRAVAAVAAAATRRGLTRRLPYLASVRGETLIDHLASRVGEPLAAAINVGPPRANRKPVLHLLDERGASVAHAKVAVNELTTQRLSTEREALQTVTDAGPEGLLTPRVVDSGNWRGHEFLVMSPVPTGTARPDSDQLSRAMHRLVAAFPQPEPALAQADWWERTGTALATQSSPEARRLSAAVNELTVGWGDVGMRHGATHGDWTPWNCATHDGRLSVWDWERFSPDRPVGWDALHYALAERLRGRRSRQEALAGVRRSAESLVRSNGGDPDRAALVYASYLVQRGATFVLDQQLAAGAPNGPLGQWLLPELETVVRELGSAR